MYGHSLLRLQAGVPQFVFVDGPAIAMATICGVRVGSDNLRNVLRGPAKRPHVTLVVWLWSEDGRGWSWEVCVGLWRETDKTLVRGSNTRVSQGMTGTGKSQDSLI